MTWEPQPEGLQQIITILKESQSPDTATQRAVQLVSLADFDRHTIFFAVQIAKNRLVIHLGKF